MRNLNREGREERKEKKRSSALSFAAFAFFAVSIPRSLPSNLPHAVSNPILSAAEGHSFNFSRGSVPRANPGERFDDRARD